jgi:quinoprotein glucose dehydrogenase
MKRSIARIIYYSLLIFNPATTTAQLSWVNVDSLYQPLPKTLHVYKSTDLLDGKPNIAFYVIADLKDKKLPNALKLALRDKDEALRKEAIRLRAALAPADAIAPLIGSLETGSVQEQQSALMALAGLKEERVDAIVAQWLDKLLAGTIAKELQLDLLNAASHRAAPVIQAKLQKYKAARKKDDPLAGYAETLFGGDAQAGKQIFFDRQDVACFRCHKLNGEGGEVGPELTGIGGKQSRQYLLEALIYPNKQITPGFGSLLVTMKDGRTFAGLLKSEAGDDLVLNSPEDGIVKLKKADIQSREKGLSAMPEALTSILSKKELRDLIEFLASSK